MLLLQQTPFYILPIHFFLFSLCVLKKKKKHFKKLILILRFVNVNFNYKLYLHYEPNNKRNIIGLKLNITYIQLN